MIGASNQKKFLLVAGIAVAVIYFAPSFINAYRREAFIREQNAARVVNVQALKPPAGKTASPLPAYGAPPASAAAGTSADSSPLRTPQPPSGFQNRLDNDPCKMTPSLRRLG